MKVLAYQRVYLDLKEKIKTREYAPNSMLPIEPELQEIYSVSRTTIRRALKQLAEEGLISTQQGRGSLVNILKVENDFNHITSVTESLELEGYTVTTKGLHVDCIIPEDSLVETLQMQSMESVVRIQRIQLANQVPVCIMFNYIPAARVPGLEKENIRDGSLYQYLEEHYDFFIHHTRNKIYAAPADFMEAQVLNTTVGFPMLIIERICYNEKNQPISKDVAHILSNRYAVNVSASGRRKSTTDIFE